MSAQKSCPVCHDVTAGFASINGVRYCHEGDSPTCYEIAQQVLNADLHARIVGDVFASGGMLTNRRRAE